MTNRIKKGMAWVTTSLIARNLVSILQISVLTRILDKSDFGIVAVASLFVSFTQLFMDMGISSGILHKNEITKNEYSSLFWLNIAAGMLLTGVLFLVSPLLTKSYHSDDLLNIVHILCFSILISSIGNQQRVVCQKQSNFKRLSIIEIVTALITFTVVISAALMGYGVYSLAYSSIAGALFNNVSHLLFGLFKDNRISFHFSLSEVKPFLKIGVYSVGSQILDFFTKEMDIIIVSSTLGLEFLGVYNVAKKLSLAIYRFITPVISKVFTPIFAEMNSNMNRLYEGYIKLSSSISMLSMPLFFLISAMSPTIMNIMFGASFVEGAPVQSVFAIMYAFNAFLGICGSLQIATGRTDIGMIWTIFGVIATAVIFYTSSLFGIKIFLCGILLRIFVDVIGSWYIQFRVMIKLKFKDYLNIFMTPFIISSLLSLPFFIFFYNSSWVTLIVGSLVYLILYLCILYTTSYRILLKEVVSRILN